MRLEGCPPANDGPENRVPAPHDAVGRRGCDVSLSGTRTRVSDGAPAARAPPGKREARHGCRSRFAQQSGCPSGDKRGARNANRNQRSWGRSLLHGRDMDKTQDHRNGVGQWVAVGGGWRLAAVGGWRLAVVGGWWRAAHDQRAHSAVACSLFIIWLLFSLSNAVWQLPCVCV